MYHSSTSHSWLGVDPSEIDCLCLGTGRFLRSVLVPALVGRKEDIGGLGMKPAMIQTRGRSFLEYMQRRTEPTYEIDTVLPSGRVETTFIPCYGAFSLGNPEDKHDLVELLPKMKRYVLIGG